MNSRTSKINLRIVTIEVTDLFGTLHHTIPLGDEGISIIHGPNGCGKTTVLGMLSAVADNDLGLLRSIDFKNFILTFSDESKLVVTREISAGSRLINENAQTTLTLDGDGEDVTDDLYNSEIIKNVSLRVTLIKKDGSTLNEEKISTASFEDLLDTLKRQPSIISRRLPDLLHIGPRAWRDRVTGQRYTLSEIGILFRDKFLIIPAWLSSITSNMKLGFINAQRLLEITGRSNAHSEERGTQVRDFVHVYSDEIKVKIDDALRLSAVISQKRERSFPQRILQKEYDKVSDAEIRSRYEKLQARFSKLAETGLQEEFAEINLPPERMNPTERRVLTLYLDDLNEKLDVFSVLQSQIDTLIKIIAKKFRRKSFNIDRENGFAIRSDSSEEPISPSVLSSGEQHQIVMFYDLIFSKDENLLFLIDEPEISLHVEWQRQFIDDLMSVAALRGHRFLIATHSPQVIGGRRHLAVALDGGVE